MANLIRIAINGARRLIESAHGLAVEPAPWKDAPQAQSKPADGSVKRS